MWRDYHLTSLEDPRFQLPGRNPVGFQSLVGSFRMLTSDSNSTTKKGAPGAGENGRQSGWRRPSLRQVIPYLVTILILAVIFHRVPITQVLLALRHTPLAKFFLLFFPLSVWYLITDSAALVWVVRRFNAPLGMKDVVPMRASMYLPGLINSNLGYAGIAYYLHRKSGIAFAEAASTLLYISFLDIYESVLFSSLGLLLYSAHSGGLIKLEGAMRFTYLVMWAFLFAVMALSAVARRNDTVRSWAENHRFGLIAKAFVKATPLDYLVVGSVKTAGFITALAAQYVTLGMFGIAVPFLKLMTFLPLVYIAAALPIAFANLSTGQAAWLLLFAANGAPADLLAYSLVAHFMFVLCSGFLGLCYLRRASRELSAAAGAAGTS